MAADRLEVSVEGSGPRVVLVHGSVMGADLVWSEQAPLAERWTLVKPNRRGFGNSPVADGEDFEVDAQDIAELIEDGDHVVGFSYGGVVALLATALRRDAVASLAVLEPPAIGLIDEEDVGRKAIAELVDLRRRHQGDDDAFVRAFSDWVGSPSPMPDQLPPPIVAGARLAFRQRLPEEAVIPLEVLRVAPFPILVVRGDGHAMFGRICDVLGDEVGAERAYVGGVGHMIPFAGPALNDELERFWTAAASSRT